jgi:hypothetical protein
LNEISQAQAVQQQIRPPFEEIRDLVAQKKELTRTFKDGQIKKRQSTEVMMKQAFVPISRHFKSSVTTGDLPKSVIFGNNATSMTEESNVEVRDVLEQPMRKKIVSSREFAVKRK